MYLINGLYINIRRYEHEVINGIINIEKWKKIVKEGLKHYKELCPNLKYIEVLNESQNNHFGGLNDEKYYIFYQAAYEVVNELNVELSPAIPFYIGGPTASGEPLHLTNHKLDTFNRINKAQHIYRFLKKFKADTCSEKKLDFLSFHEYAIGENPAILISYESIINSFLKELNLSTNLPLFLDEIGVDHPKSNPVYNLKQACGITTFFNYTRKLENLKLFPWVIYHFPGQRSLVMFDENLILTSFGMAVKMSQLHKEIEIETFSNVIDENGIGVHAIATKNENDIAIQLWNYQDKKDTVIVSLRNFPDKLMNKKLSVTKFLIDSSHNNIAAVKRTRDKLIPYEKFVIKGNAIKNFEQILDPYALCLYHIKIK